MEMITVGFIAAVFAAGLLSFFSPCILPLLPVYLGYLSGGAEGAQGGGHTSVLKALVFVGGLSASFVLLGCGAGALGGLIANNWFFIGCGAVIVVFGLHQMGLIRIPLLERQKKLDMRFNPRQGLMGAFLLGFLFSFGWTPCVGPVLGAVLGLSSQQGSALTGGGLLMVYALGLSLPFAALAFGSRHLLGRIKGIYPHFGKIRAVGGLLILLMGVWMIWGQVELMQARQTSPGAQGSAISPAFAQKMEGLNAAPASLADFKGKIVYVKFWATWCPLCLAGLEDFAALSGEYSNAADVAVISVVTPGLNGEMGREDFTAWATGQGFDFPIYFDNTGVLAAELGIRAYPTSIYLNKEGRLAKQAVGGLSNAAVREELFKLGAVTGLGQEE